MTVDTRKKEESILLVARDDGEVNRRLMRRVDPVRRFATLTFLRGALVSLAITVIAGLASVFYYVPTIGMFLARHGVTFTAVRPLHTTFASAWLFLGSVAVAHRYLQDHAPPAGRMDRWALRVQVILWALAGVGVLVTLPLGIMSGREYLGFHPALSIPILLGWLVFAWSFFKATWRGFWSRPVYVTMWGVGILFFIFTFIEQHAWLLPRIFANPIVDLRLQWKATGTLVGSFNLLVYGSLLYVTEKVSGDERYAHSRLAYTLFGVGLLNSFTNFAHHTYHIPQSEIVKTISFFVSMSEALIFTRVIWDLAGSVGRRSTGGRRVDGCFNAPRFFLSSTKWWTSTILFVSLLISIPPLNSLIHGTHVVTAHAMGAEIGIDSMILFAAISWMLTETQRGGPDADALLCSTWMRLWAVWFNWAAAFLIAWLLVSGVVVGETRYQNLPPPGWLGSVNGFIFAGTGLAAGVLLALLLTVWLRLAFRRATGPLLHAPGVYKRS